MAQKKNHPQQPKTTARQPAPGARKATPNKTSFYKRYEHLLLPTGIALLPWLFLSACLGNKFTNWDDPSYVTENGLIKNLSADTLGQLFSTSVMGNYHPLTILSYAIEYSYVRLEPWLYHFDSLLWHVIATVLVYTFVRLLTRKPLAAVVTALLFGLHPMHVESVAWVAGRKDVMYGTFYMASCITYLYYLRRTGKGKWKWYAATIALFACSLLSKPVAVTLPVTLLLIDYFEQRKFHYNVLLEKLPHFALAIACGIRSIQDQGKFGALDTRQEVFTYLEHIPLGAYALITYLWKAVVPVGLSCFYPYPEQINGALPATYYIYPVAVLALVFLVWRFLRGNRPVLFGILFFIVNIALLLQFLPVGAAIIADRYSYIPYVGLFFIAGWYVAALYEDETKKQLLKPVLGLTAAYILVLGYMSRERCTTWYDTTTLWRDVVKKEPGAYNAYNNLGFNYFNLYHASVNPNEQKVYYDSALYFLRRSIELQPDFANAYISMGELMRSSGRFAEAKGLYHKALSLHKDKQPEAWLGLAITYAMTSQLDSSAICFRQAITLQPVFAEAHSNYGNLLSMVRRNDEAIEQYNIAIAQNPDNDEFFLNRGHTYQNMGRWPEALQNYERAIALNPAQGANYYGRSFYYAHTGDRMRALADVQKAIALGYGGVDKGYYQSLQH